MHFCKFRGREELANSGLGSQSPSPPDHVGQNSGFFFFSFLKKSEILSQFINQSEIIHSQLFILLRTGWAFLSLSVSVIHIKYTYILYINIYVYILY